MANSYTDRLKIRIPDEGDEDWKDERDTDDYISDVVMGALLTSNRVIKGGAVSAATGLDVNITEVIADVAGGVFTIVSGTYAMTAASTTPEQVNWIYIDNAGTLTVSLVPPTGDYIPLALVDTDATTVIRIADLRPMADRKGLAWEVATASKTAVSGRGYLTDVSAAVKTITLPLNPVEGDTIGIKDFTGNAVTFNITVARNGKNIEGAASDYIIKINKWAGVFVYSDAAQGWVLTSTTSDGEGGFAWEVVAVNTAAVSGSGYLVDCSAAVKIITLPTSPSEGDTVGIMDFTGSAATFNITVERNGSNIMGLPENMTISQAKAGCVFVCSDTTEGWVIPGGAW